jgi:hypothetical protein
MPGREPDGHLGADADSWQEWLNEIDPKEIFVNPERETAAGDIEVWMGDSKLALDPELLDAFADWAREQDDVEYVQYP